jgi:hypothetical protein
MNNLNENGNPRMEKIYIVYLKSSKEGEEAMEKDMCDAGARWIKYIAQKSHPRGTFWSIVTETLY